MSDYRIVSYPERPDLATIADDTNSAAWPAFMLEDAIANRLWNRLADDLPDYQFMMIDSDDNIIATGNSMPFVWDGRYESLSDDGWDWVMVSGFEALDSGKTPTAVSALSISILPEYQGQGISRRMVTFMRDNARRHGLHDLFAPVRPNQKPAYPLTPIDRYITWTNDEGAPFDPWLRVHWRLGAQIIKPAPRSMVIEGSVADWEQWAGMRFPESGDYVVPGALNPVSIDREADLGRYVEPNVWMHHRFGDSTP